MDCPFCGGETREGAIPSGRQLKWVDSGAEDSPWGAGVPLNGFFGGEIKGLFCPGCRQIVIPVPEIEGAAEMLRRTLDTASEKLGTAKQQWEARREEEKTQKKKKNFGEKDPWEL